MKPLNVLLNTTLLSIALISSSTLLAQEYENTTNVSAGVTGYFPHSGRNTDDNIGLAVGLELPISERWSLSPNFYAIDSEVKNSNTDADINFFRFGFNYHLNQLNGWQPYVSFGLGMLEVDQDVSSFYDRDEGTLDVGIGIKRFISDRWLLRGDYKTVRGNDTHGYDDLVSVSLGYAFGARSSSSTPAAQPVSDTSPTMLDSDNDGVQDSSDACSNTPAGARVDSRGCEVDSDRDGVVDSRDNCPDTPANLAVDNNGCPMLDVSQRRQELLVNFEFDRTEVRPQYDNEIGNFAEFMNDYGNTNVVIEGHTDSVGTEEYNQGLSERRANAVRDELVNENGIAASRVSTVGYGEARPASTNNTDAGRAQNRRIEAVISVEIEEQRRR